ncbi:hypothetical protein OS493_019373 [Desmophyllum pertusum]|uniref:Protein kinase domain-containing protein n=1 Tax=Desmophyllum pertusum TaxID=174260 RepID=A0A9X0D8H8_9CNID|nr:hypothetical protein OS493_019373 [Desmophyllum pertusum]
MQLVLGKKILQALLDRNEEINKEEIYSSPLTRRVVQVNQNPNGARKKSSSHTYQQRSHWKVELDEEIKCKQEKKKKKEATEANREGKGPRLKAKRAGTVANKLLDVLAQHLTCGSDLGKIFGYGLLYCAEDRQNFVRDVISTALQAVSEKQGIRKALSRMPYDDLNRQYLEAQRVPDWIHALSRKEICDKAVWLNIVGEVASAMLHDNKVGFLHNDIKTDNVVLDKTETEEKVEYNPVLIDFGKSLPMSGLRGPKSLSKGRQKKYMVEFPHIAPEIVTGKGGQSVERIFLKAKFPMS